MENVGLNAPVIPPEKKAQMSTRIAQEQGRPVNTGEINPVIPNRGKQIAAELKSQWIDDPDVTASADGWVDDPYAEVAAPEQPGKAPRNLLGAAADVGRLIYDIPTQTMAAAGNLAEGDDPGATYDWRDRWREAGVQRTEERKRALGEKAGEKVAFGITRGDIADASGSTGFTLASMGAGLAGGAAGSPVGPVTAGAGFLAASGAAAYKMDKTMFTANLIDVANNALKEERGSPMTAAERQELLARTADARENHALWEAGPEAVGNLLTATGIGSVFSGVSKRVIGKIVGGLAKMYGGELSTETVTQMGQQRAEADTGMTNEQPREWTSAEDWKKSFEEIYPQTMVIASIMGGGAAVTGKAADLLAAKEEQKPQQTVIEQARADAEVIKAGGVIPGADAGRVKKATLVALYGENDAVRQAIEGGHEAVIDRMLKVAPKVSQIRESEQARAESVLAKIAAAKAIPEEQQTPMQAALAKAKLPSKADQIKAEKIAAQAKIDEASRQAATSPENNLPEPTDAQKEAGNYAKGHITLNGLNIAIENPKGSERTGIGENETPWKITMQNPYGYIKKTEGGDGEQVDVYLGDHVTKDSPAFVIDQIDPKTGKFDEHKVVYGARGYGEAKEIYDAHFADKSGESRRGAVTKMSADEFKTWLKGDTTKPVKYVEKGLGAKKTGGEQVEYTDWADVGNGYQARQSKTHPIQNIKTPEGNIITRGLDTTGKEYMEFEGSGDPFAKGAMAWVDKAKADLSKLNVPKLTEVKNASKVESTTPVGEQPGGTQGVGKQGREGMERGQQGAEAAGAPETQVRPGAKGVIPQNARLPFADFMKNARLFHGKPSLGETPESLRELQLQHLEFIESALEEGHKIPASVLEGHEEVDAEDFPLASALFESAGNAHDRAARTKANINKKVIEFAKTAGFTEADAKYDWSNSVSFGEDLIEEIPVVTKESRKKGGKPESILSIYYMHLPNGKWAASTSPPFSTASVQYFDYALPEFFDTKDEAINNAIDEYKARAPESGWDELLEAKRPGINTVKPQEEKHEETAETKQSEAQQQEETTAAIADNIRTLIARKAKIGQQVGGKALSIQIDTVIKLAKSGTGVAKIKKIAKSFKDKDAETHTAMSSIVNLLSPKTAKKAQKPSSDLIARMRQLGGISSAYRNDIMPDAPANIRMIFSKDGNSPDDMVSMLEQDGFVFAEANKPEDQLREAIQAYAGGKRSFKTAQVETEAEQLATNREYDAILAHAVDLGIDTQFMSQEQIEDAIYEAEDALTMARMDAEGLNDGETEVLSDMLADPEVDADLPFDLKGPANTAAIDAFFNYGANNEKRDRGQTQETAGVEPAQGAEDRQRGGEEPQVGQGQTERNLAERDALFDKAVGIVRQEGRASISLVQRNLHIDYLRASRLVGKMEADGIIGPKQSNGQHAVIKETLVALGDIPKSLTIEIQTENGLEQVNAYKTMLAANQEVERYTALKACL